MSRPPGGDDRGNNWLEDDLDRVRLKLRILPSGAWSVYETFAADGSLAIGIASTPLPPGAVMVIYDGLTKGDAQRAAAGLHRWRLRRATEWGAATSLPG